MRIFLTDWALDRYVQTQKDKDVEFRTHLAQHRLYVATQELRAIVNIAKMAERLVLHKNWPANNAVLEAKDFHDRITELTPKEDQ